MQFDASLQTLTQRQDFRSQQSKLLPRAWYLNTDGASPGLGGRAAAVAVFPVRGRLGRRSGQCLALLVDVSATGPAAHGVVIIDDAADRKESCAADHVACQYRISLGKIDNGIEPVTRLFADDKHYYPLPVASYTLALRLSDGKHDLMFRTKPLIALALVERARAAGIAFKAILANCFYGENNALGRALLES